jgi:hypothetical protein
VWNFGKELRTMTTDDRVSEAMRIWSTKYRLRPPVAGRRTESAEFYAME